MLPDYNNSGNDTIPSHDSSINPSDTDRNENSSTEAKLEENSANDDDEWAEFVDSKTVDAIEPICLPNPSIDSKRDQIPVNNSIFDRIFKSIDNQITNEPVDVSEINIDDDEVWKSLKEFTSVNDASTSLKFKWPFSELENHFLNSINMHRQSIQNNATQYLNYMSPNGILQPVKLEAVKNTTTKNSDNSNNEANKSDKLTENRNSETNGNKSTPVLAIDLSYFENNGPEATAKTAATKNSKLTINELLKEIYVNEKESGAVSKKSKKIAQKSSLFVDWQLEPGKLEKQHYIKSLEEKTKRSREAMEFINQRLKLSGSSQPFIFSNN